MRKVLTFGWLAAIDLVFDAILAPVWFTAAVTILAVGLATLPVFGLGLPVLIAAGWLMRRMNMLERMRANALLGSEVAEPPSIQSTGEGWTGLVKRGLEPLRDPAVWRTLLHHFLSVIYGTVVLSVVVVVTTISLTLLVGPLSGRAAESLLGWNGSPGLFPASSFMFGIIGILLAFTIVYAGGRLDRAVLAPLLGPLESALMRTEIHTLTDARQGAVDAAAIERQRIERDLHDGAQPQLVAMAMTLGMAKAKFDSDPDRAKELLDQAHGEAKSAIAELRQLARGIHPAVLTDRGLSAALSAIAARCSVSTSVAVNLDARLPAEIEAVLYFVVAEALTNVDKHSGASRCHVVVESDVTTVSASVMDDGQGGASIGQGLGQGGLAGIVARVRSAGGNISIHSPAGGPTRVEVELPCEL